MDDLISRKQAIDALDGEITITGRANVIAVKGYINLVKDRLERLPPAEPEIIHCMDCDWWTKQDDSAQGRCSLMGTYPTGGWFCGNARLWGTSLTRTVDAIKQLPSAGPKRGKWLPDNNNYIYEQYVCSECKNSFKVDTCMGKPMWNFCPNCGAKMEETT